MGVMVAARGPDRGASALSQHSAEETGSGEPDVSCCTCTVRGCGLTCLLQVFPPVATDLSHQSLAVRRRALQLLQPALQGVRGLQHRGRIWETHTDTKHTQLMGEERTSHLHSKSCFTVGASVPVQAENSGETRLHRAPPRRFEGATGPSDTRAPALRSLMSLLTGRPTEKENKRADVKT